MLHFSFNESLVNGPVPQPYQERSEKRGGGLDMRAAHPCTPYLDEFTSGFPQVNYS